MRFSKVRNGRHASFNKAGLTAVALGVFAAIAPASYAYVHTNPYCQGCVVYDYKMDLGDTGDDVESYAHYIGSGIRKVCANVRSASGASVTGSTCVENSSNDVIQYSHWNNVFASTKNNTGGSQITENAHGNYK